MIRDSESFRRLAEHIASAVYWDRRIPEQVFRDGYGQFRFMDFDLFGSSGLLAVLRQLMRASGDPGVNLMVLDPDPELYYFRNFGTFGVLEIPIDFSAEQYTAALNSAPPDSPADSLLNSGRVMVWAPPSLRWAIRGERTPEIMILAAEDRFRAPAEATLTDCGICLITAEDAVDIGSRVCRERNEKAQFASDFMKHYGPGKAWADPDARRALDIATRFVDGEIGAITTSRELSSLRHRFGKDLASLFLIFAGVDSETDDLPIGPVRAEWNREALAAQDIEIARCEQLYGPVVRETCKELIGLLRPTEQQR